MKTKIVKSVNNLLIKHGMKSENLLHLVTVGSRYYGYNSENSDYDIIGVYFCENRPSIHFSNKLTKYVENITEKIIIDGIVIEITLYDFEKWLYLLANNSLNIAESLFNYNRLIETKLRITKLQRIYVEHFNSGLIHNLLNFSTNCYVDFLNGKTDSIVMGMNKHLFYAKFRLYQAYKLFNLFTNAGNDITSLRYNVAYILSNDIMLTFEELDKMFSVELINELREKTKLIVNSPERFEKFYEVFANLKYV